MVKPKENNKQHVPGVTYPQDNVKKKTKKVNSTIKHSGNVIAAGVNGKSPIYQQIDKLEFFIPSDNISKDDIPQKSYMVAIPVTDKDSNLRVAKIRSVRVHIWNRGPQDLYLEVLQPFGAHQDSNKIVAWGPVKGAKGKPQTKWTIKANKSGGSFRLDVSDNNFTLPATQIVKKGDVNYLEMLCFGFAITRNAVTFTGTDNAKSNRSLQVKMVIDYIGPESKEVEAVVGDAPYTDLGKVVKYPQPSALDIYRKLGIVPVSFLYGEVTVPADKVQLDATQGAYKWYVDTQSGPKTIGTNQYAFFLRAPDLLGSFLYKTFKLGEVVPIYPVSGLVWRTDDRQYRDNIVGSGFGDCLVHRDYFPEWQRPSKDGWYVACRYHNDVNYNNAPVIHFDPSGEHDVLNSFFYYQYAVSNRMIRLSEMVPVKDGIHAASTSYNALFGVTKTVRPVLKKKAGLESDAQGVQFAFTTFISMLTVVVKVVEAAYDAYTQFAPAKLVCDMPNHQEHVENGEFVLLEA